MIKEIRAESKMDLLDKEQDERCKSLKDGECIVTIAVCLPAGGITCDTKVSDIILSKGMMPDVVGQIARMVDDRINHESEILKAYERGLEDAKKAVEKAMDGNSQKDEPKPEEPAPEAPKAE